MGQIPGKSRIEVGGGMRARPRAELRILVVIVTGSGEVEAGSLV